jgi:hypothetical protein
VLFSFGDGSWRARLTDLQGTSDFPRQLNVVWRHSEHECHEKGAPGFLGHEQASLLQNFIWPADIRLADVSIFGADGAYLRHHQQADFGEFR